MRFKNCSHEIEYCENSCRTAVQPPRNPTPAPLTQNVVNQTPKQRMVPVPASSVWTPDISPLFRMPDVKGYKSYELYARTLEDSTHELIHLVKHRMRGNNAEVFLCYGIIEYFEHYYVILQLKRTDSVIVATIKRVDAEYLPMQKKAIEVDLMGCRLPFWLQLTQEECPRKLYLEEGIDNCDPVLDEFTFRRTLRRKPEAESNFEHQAAVVEEIERKANKDQAHKKKNKTAKRAKKTVRAAKESDSSDGQGMNVESDLSESELELNLREQQLRDELQQLENSRSKTSTQRANLKRGLVVASTGTDSRKLLKNNTAKKVALLNLAESSEQNRHERNLESIRHDEHQCRLQNMWIDILEDT